jgi:hypothetical protein
MTTIISPISQHKFYCDKCLINCSRKSEWLRHIETKKHKINKFGENSIILATTVTPNICECGKQYKDRTGLWRHKKKCTLINITANNENTNKEENNNITPDLILNIIKQNQEFKDLLLEQNKTIIELSKNSTTNNKNN